MSRSHVLTAFLTALLFALTARSAPAQEGTVLDLIGAVDYNHGPSILEVGSWVSYRMTTTDDKGVSDECTVTIMIAGEEEWWGEDCFWVETSTKRGKDFVLTAATLMSTAIFQDSTPVLNVLRYQRKRISELDENGQPLQQTMRRGAAAIKTRVPPNPGLTTLVDTLGTDTVRTVAGDFVCRTVRIEKGIRSTAQSADSSKYTEDRDVRVTHQTPLIPVTGIAREEINFSSSSRKWLIGHSSESSPLNLIGSTKTLLELVAYGTQGLEAKYVPVEFRNSLAEQRAVPVSKRKAPAAKSAPLSR